MPLAELAALLRGMGFPEAKAPGMAEQLDRRARQLASRQGRSHEEALTHLLGLMKEGWAAKGKEHENNR